MKTSTLLETRIRAVFAALSRDDMDDLVSHWADDGIYFNPTVGAPAQGKTSVKSTIATMSEGLRGRGENLVIDRITESPSANPPRAFVEWHVESSGARNGKLGLHTISFDENGLFHRVTVFSHA